MVLPVGESPRATIRERRRRPALRPAAVPALLSYALDRETSRDDHVLLSCRDTKTGGNRTDSGKARIRVDFDATTRMLSDHYLGGRRAP